MSAATHYVLLRGNVYMPVTTSTGDFSYNEEDVEYYDGSNYRDSFADYNPSAANTQPGILYTTAASISGNYAISDDVAHEPPRYEKKKRTRIKFWDNVVAGSGKCIAWVWSDRFVMVSTDAPAY